MRGLAVCLFYSAALLHGADNADILRKNEAVFGVRYSSYATDSFWNRRGDKIKSYNDFKRYRGDAAILFGLTASDTVQLQGGYSRVQESANGNTTGFDDLQLSWKHYFGRALGHYVTGRLMAIVPVEERRASLRVGRFAGQADLFIRRDLCLAGRPVWYDLGVGGRIYQGYPSNQLRGYFELGVTPWRRLSIIADGRIVYGRLDHCFDAPNVIVNNSNYRLLYGRLYASFELWRSCYLFGGGYSHLWGRRIGTSGGFICGGWVTF